MVVILILLGNASLWATEDTLLLLVNVELDFDVFTPNLGRSAPDESLDVGLLSTTEDFVLKGADDDEGDFGVVSAVELFFLDKIPGLGDPARGLVVPDLGLMAPERGLEAPEDDAVPDPPFPFLSSNIAFRSCTLAGFSGVWIEDNFRALLQAAPAPDDPAKPVSRTGSAPVLLRLTPNGFCAMFNVYSDSCCWKKLLFYRMWGHHWLIKCIRVIHLCFVSFISLPGIALYEYFLQASNLVLPVLWVNLYSLSTTHTVWQKGWC